MIARPLVARRLLHVLGLGLAVALGLLPACASSPAVVKQSQRAAQPVTLQPEVIAPASAPAVVWAPAPVQPIAPIALRKPRTTEHFDEQLIDDYFWLREKENPEVIEYLNAENAHTDAAMGHTKPLQEKLYQEMLGRIQETDLTVPYRKGEYFYYTRTEQGKPYRIYCRKKGSLDAPEQILLDMNQEAAALGAKYYAIGVFEVSPDHSTLAFAYDTTGGERYTLRFKNLDTGELSPEQIEGVYYSGAWALDNRTFFYVTVDDAVRPEKAWRHTLGTTQDRDTLVYHESDERYFLNVGLTRSEQYIMIALGSMKTNEWRFIPADAPQAEPRVIWPRVEGVEYSVDHRGDRFYIATNADNAINFKLLSVPVENPASGVEVILPHSRDVYITGVNCFRDYLVIETRERGLPQIRVRPLAPGAGREHSIEFPEVAFNNGVHNNNEEFDTTTLRFFYTSLITPSSVFDYDMGTRQRTLMKEQPVLGGYDRTLYTVKRAEARAPDGERVPISLVYRTDRFKADGSNPCLLNGYGSYGFSFDAGFSSNALSLLDRGFVYAIAHIRGGSEKGRSWYEDGRLMNKKNSFTDFIATAEHLVKQRYTSKDRLAILGGSAGGLLMGAVANMRPDLFRVVVAAVPFVDVINTMTDPSIPLTVTEWEQWGNPCNDEAAYDYMKSYSPYDNVGPKPYPNMLVLAGLNDPRVAYWEPAKWTAKLRATAFNAPTPTVQPGATLLLRTNMGAGHGGAADRYERLREIALEYAFILDRLGLRE